MRQRPRASRGLPLGLYQIIKTKQGKKISLEKKGAPVPRLKERKNMLEEIFEKFKKWREAEEEADKKYEEFQIALKNHRDEFYEYLYEKNKKGEIKIDWC